jgi:hypothetical protein
VDQHRFDTLTRTISTVRSRRAALGTLLAGTLGLLDLAETSAKKACATCKKRKHGKCKANLPDSTPCSTGKCQSGRCVAAAAPPQPHPPDVCQRHNQCASGLCEATSGTCVAQCDVLFEACGDGCVCLSIGTGSAGHACLQVPEDRNCAGYTPCTWNDDAADPADALSCPNRPGEICSANGLCSGPEEVCLPLCPPSRRR